MFADTESFDRHVLTYVYDVVFTQGAIPSVAAIADRLPIASPARLSTSQQPCGGWRRTMPSSCSQTATRF